MNLKKRWKADREALKKLSGREKWLFVWDYYKIPLIALCCVIFLTAITLLTGAGREEVALYAVFVNSDRNLEEPDSTQLDALAERAGIPMEGRTVDVTANLTLGQNLNEAYDAQTVQVLGALFGISDLDLFAADQAVFERYAQQDAFADLSVLIDRELLAGADLYRRRYRRSLCRLCPQGHARSDQRVHLCGTRGQSETRCGSLRRRTCKG